MLDSTRTPNGRLALGNRLALERLEIAPPCECCYEHRPAVLEPQAHHLWPVYLGGPVHPQTLLGLCPTTHTNVHRMLRAMVKAGRTMTRDELAETGRPYPPKYAWWVACTGWLAWDAAGRP
jgi:hypothetical protein